MHGLGDVAHELRRQVQVDAAAREAQVRHETHHAVNVEGDVFHPRSSIRDLRAVDAQEPWVLVVLGNSPLDRLLPGARVKLLRDLQHPIVFQDVRECVLPNLR